MDANALADEAVNVIENNAVNRDGIIQWDRMRGIIRDKLQAVYEQTCRNLGAVPQALSARPFNELSDAELVERGMKIVNRLLDEQQTPIPTTPAITEPPWRVPGDAPAHTPWDDFQHTLTLVRGISEADRQVLKDAAEQVALSGGIYPQPYRPPNVTGPM